MSYQPNNPRPISTLKTLSLSKNSPKSRLSITFPADSPHTKQEFKEECDINTLMNQYMSTGEMPHINERAPQYLDATGFDYQTQMEFVAGAKSLFGAMPSALRNRFDNDPALFLDFCSDERNLPEMKALGLLKPESEVPQYPTGSYNEKRLEDELKAHDDALPNNQSSTSQPS